MRRDILSALIISFFLIGTAAAQTAVQLKPGRDQKQPIDEEYTQKIREYTTQTIFNSPLTDYLPASKTVPTPKAVIGDIAGAPGKLPYSHEVYRYMRMLEQASPRVKVFSIGTTEEGREMIAVAVASEALIAKLDENRARLAKLADPRTIGMNDDEAEKLIADSTPIYYLTGTIHSPESGAPTALMELAYRLAVDESEYIEHIRNSVITLITPVVEVDGRDRMVDVYNWHLANPDKNWPNLIYWGHYVAHDNNRDSMSLSLNLTRNVLKTYLDWKVQVLHDLHESVAYLYDNTIGAEPYNAWLDPLLTNEWQLIGWNNVAEMTRMGMPGVFTYGTFDTWSPSYLMFIAASHNGISRLYETFGNGGADTVERTLSPREYSRTWYRQNPPLPKAMWSQRNNNNYQQTAILVSLAHFGTNAKYFLRNFWTKSKNTILKPTLNGPAAYVLPGDDLRPGGQAELLRLLQTQGCEIHRATEAFKVKIPAKKSPAREAGDGRDGRAPASENSQTKPETEKEFPAGSYIVRMDQPYSRIADMMLDHQYWSPNDPQRNIYDDTAWTFGELGNVQVVRVTDTGVLDAKMEKVNGEVRSPGGVAGSGSVFLVNHNADNALVTLRYRFKDARFEAAEEPFEAGGRKFNRGSFIITNIDSSALGRTALELGLQALAVPAAPSVKTHPIRAPRIAVMHTWLSTQNEGWWRIALDQYKVPFDYISTQDVAKDDKLRGKYDVIIFAPVGRANPQAIVSGMPMFGNPLPWKKTDLTPNLGRIDSTEDMRPGLGFSGLQHLHDFVNQGGLLITANDTADFAAEYGFTPGVSSADPQRMRAPGTVVKSRLVDGASPIAYGYPDQFSIFYASGPIFGLSNTAGGRGGRRFGGGEGGQRETGRGTADDPDTPQNRPVSEIPVPPKSEAWQATPLTDEQLRNGVYVIPPAVRPRVILRYGDARELLVSGLLEGGNELAQRAAVIDVPYGNGHVVLFSNNPMWRAETQGSYFMVFNAIMNFDQLNAGRKLDEK